MKKLFLVSIFYLLIITTGCAKFATLKHPITMDVKTCEVSTSSQILTGAYIGDARFESCINNLESKGYRKE